MVPYADAKLLRIICEWGNWIFPFDDLFDNGDVRENSTHAEKVMRRMEESFCEGDGDRQDHALLHDGENFKRLFELARMHGGIYKSIAEHCSPGQSDARYTRHTKHVLVAICDIDYGTGVQHRYVASMRQYSSGTLAQVRQAQTTRTGTFEEVLAQRRQSVCVTPLFVLVEFGHRIDLLDVAFENANVRRVEVLGVEITLLHNDLLSYCKEEEEGVMHNTVAVCRLQGMSAQDAVTFVGTEVSCRMAEFEEAVRKLRESKHGRANELMRYVQGIRDVIKANLWWSLRTERFLSEQQKLRLLTAGTLEVASIMPCCHRFTAHPSSNAVTSTESNEGFQKALPFAKEVETHAA